MLRTKSLYLKSLRGLQRWSEPDLLRLFSSRFSPGLGFGFSDAQLYQSTINSTLVYQTVAFQRVYNPEKDEFDLQEQHNYFQVPFSIDVKREFLHIYVGGERLQRLVGILSQLLARDIEIDDVHIDINSIVVDLKSSETKFDIIGLVVNNFRPKPGLSGRFAASVANQESAQYIIRDYESDIKEAVIQLYFGDDKVLWKLSNSGKVAVRSDEDSLDNQIDIVKETILRWRDA
jgi:hypothetical protein